MTIAAVAAATRPQDQRRLGDFPRPKRASVSAADGATNEHGLADGMIDLRSFGGSVPVAIAFWLDRLLPV
jgi:hypothetical protein